MGDSGSVEKSPAMKWALNVLISCSAIFRKCIPGVDSWKSMPLALSFLWKAGEASFSSLIYYGLIPLMSRCSWRSLKTRTDSLSDLAFMGLTNVLLLSYSYIYNRYLFPLLEVTGNLPVRYVAICLHLVGHMPIYLGSVLRGGVSLV